MKHVMIDLETLGTQQDSVFLSVAAVQFDLHTGETGEEFYETITLDSALKAGRTIDSNTLEWWMGQNPQTMRLMFRDPSPLGAVLLRLFLFIRTNGIEFPWGNSASFDLGMLNDAYKASDLKEAPWHYSQERCYRTVNALFDFVGDMPDNFQPHHPSHDCHFQIAMLCNKFKNLNTKKDG